MFCLFAILLSLLLPPLAVAEETLNRTTLPGPVVINPNGGWSWFGDERAVVDADRNLLYVGSLANRAGYGGPEKDGDVEVTRVDLSSGEATTDVLRDALTSYGGGDDHNVPSLLLLPDGRVLAAYTGHNNNSQTYFRTYDPDSQQWDSERVFDWNAAIPGGSTFNCTYNNLFYLPADGAIYNISRNHERCPNAIVSHDMGQTWEYAGQLVRASEADGATGLYVNGYLKYSQRGDRVDLIATERHPRNFNNSLYHGYLEGGVLHAADGKAVDTQLDADAAAQATDLTQVFAAGTNVDGVPMTHCWMLDFERFADGAVVALFKARVDDSIEDHQFFYGVFRDGQWRAFPLARAGGRLFRNEEDYTGLAAIDPNDPSTVYISTSVDPNSSDRLAHHELFQGRTPDGGRSWRWRAVTHDSKADNLRPIIPRWKPGRTALIWNRGTMRTSQNYDQQVVLLIDPLQDPSSH
ncbi:hypothetical protein Pla123a_47230 [Posidoniimonas polymericola]|uniref:BNR/Asp-box repeat protein n=1 Tax=Posidoniimonas polymericola TaxID=2528002 RepID=A0A5C5XV02_9BACT|nr:BNR-4 repeat-containing protein [Posidoniimonas polymericola]TWT66329.1 hypothetical protein Pla123a_47230 [Posidoniimonas polymericola]